MAEKKRIYGKWENNLNEVTGIWCTNNFTQSKLCFTAYELTQHCMYSLLHFYKEKQTDIVDAVQENKLDSFPQIITPFPPKSHLFYICFNNFIFIGSKIVFLKRTRSHQQNVKLQIQT